MSSNDKSIGNTLYDDSASLGRFMATIYLVIGVIISAVLIILGVKYFFTNTDDQYIDIKATIVKPTCIMSSYYDNNSKSTKFVYNCTIPLAYSYDGKNYNTTVNSSSSTNYIDNQEITITIKKDNPLEAHLSFTYTRTLAMIAMGIGAVLITGCYFNYYATINYKMYASATGAKTVYDVIT